MKIKELFETLCFLRKCKSCIVLKDNLQLCMFGDYNETMLYYNDEIMKISIGHILRKPGGIEPGDKVVVQIRKK